MALGENKRNDFHPTVYGYQFSNPEAKVDKTALTFNWWNKMLKLSIAPKLNNGGDYSQYDHKNAISIYLSVQSAKALQMVTEDFVAWLKENAVRSITVLFRLRMALYFFPMVDSFISRIRPV